MKKFGASVSLDMNQVIDIDILKKNGSIKSRSQFIREAVTDHLKKYSKLLLINQKRIDEQYGE